MKFITSFIAFLQIVASPFLIGIFVAWMVYNNYPTNTGYIISIIISITGVLVGIFLGIRIWRKRGTVEFISSISASPELDHFEKGEELTVEQSELDRK